MPMLGAYSVSKAALLSMARALSFELADSGIRINTVCPGVVKTKFAGALVDMEDVLAQQFAMKRFGEPHEISGRNSHGLKGKKYFLLFRIGVIFMRQRTGKLYHWRKLRHLWWC